MNEKIIETLRVIRVTVNDTLTIMITKELLHKFFN